MYFVDFCFLNNGRIIVSSMGPCCADDEYDDEWYKNTITLIKHISNRRLFGLNFVPWLVDFLFVSWVLTICSKPYTLLKGYVVKAEKVLEHVKRTESWKWRHTEVTGGGGWRPWRRGGSEEERRVNRCFLYLAFLPLIGVPPGEVIWMQIRLEITISIKRR